jgi:hypothetical protein
MNQKSIAIAAVLAATMLMAIFATTPPFNIKDAEGQIIIQIPGRDGCPVGYHRSSSGTCEPDAIAKRHITNKRKQNGTKYRL